MNAHAASIRSADVAHARGLARRVYRDGEFVGRVHPTDDQQWVAEIVGRLVLGIYPTERLAVVAILDAQRRA